MTGASLLARSFACRITASVPKSGRGAFRPSGLPKRTTGLPDRLDTCGSPEASFALIACKAAEVREEMALRSCSATTPMMCTVISLASGKSQATNFTPCRSKPVRKCMSRLSRSSLAISSRAPVIRVRAIASVSCGLSACLPLSISSNSPSNSPPVRFR